MKDKFRWVVRTDGYEICFNDYGVSVGYVLVTPIAVSARFDGPPAIDVVVENSYDGRRWVERQATANVWWVELLPPVFILFAAVLVFVVMISGGKC